MSRIPWTDELIYLLFRVVHEAGAHISEYKKTEEKWNNVNDKFFTQKEVGNFFLNSKIFFTQKSAIKSPCLVQEELEAKLTNGNYDYKTEIYLSV
jgi:hypothetical protein